MSNGTMTFAPKSYPIDLTTWELLGSNEVSDAIGRQVTEALREAFEENPPRLEFDDINMPDDPATLMLSLPLGANDGADCVYTCTLEDVVEYFIDTSSAGDSDLIEDEEEIITARRIAVRLRELAAKLEAACK
jgi:hypothetical protein